MSTLYAGIGDWVASGDPQDELKTMGLGSCVGVILFDPGSRCVALAHVALPESGINPERARRQPGSFADTAIPLLLGEMRKLGWKGGRIIVKLAGGATILDANNTFNIGKRNLSAVRDALRENQLAPSAEETGGTVSRTLTVSVATGNVRISTPGREDHDL